MPADIKIDEARARMWMDDVNNELELVQSVLNKTHTAIQTIPTDDDTIFQGIRKAGSTLATAWEKVCNCFRESRGLVGNAISHAATAAEELSAGINSLIAKFGS